MVPGWTSAAGECRRGCGGWPQTPQGRPRRQGGPDHVGPVRQSRPWLDASPIRGWRPGPHGPGSAGPKTCRSPPPEGGAGSPVRSRRARVRHATESRARQRSIGPWLPNDAQKSHDHLHWSGHVCHQDGRVLHVGDRWLRADHVGGHLEGVLQGGRHLKAHASHSGWIAADDDDST